MKIKLAHLAVLAALLLLTFQILTNEWLLNFEHKESAGGIRPKSAIEKSNEGNSVYSQELNSGATTMSDNTHLADNSMMSSNGQFDGLNRVNQSPDLDRTNSNILQENCDRRTYEPKEDSPLKLGDTLLSLLFDAQKFLLALKDGEEIDRSYFKYGYWLVPYYIQFIRDNGVAPEGKKRIILILAELQADVAAPAIAELLHDERFESQVRHYFKRVVRLKFIPLLLGHLSYEAMRKNPHLASNATKIFAYYPSHEVARHLVGMIRQDIEAGKAKRALEQIFSWAPYVESAPLAGRTHEEWWRDIWEKHIATVESCDVDWWKIERIESTANAESDDAALGFPWPEGTEALQKTCAGPFRMALKPDPVFTRLLTFYSQLLDPDGKITQHIDELEKRIIFDIANEFQGCRVFGLVPILLNRLAFCLRPENVPERVGFQEKMEIMVILNALERICLPGTGAAIISLFDVDQLRNFSPWAREKILSSLSEYFYRTGEPDAVDFIFQYRQYQTIPGMKWEWYLRNLDNEEFIARIMELPANPYRSRSDNRPNTRMIDDFGFRYAMVSLNRHTFGSAEADREIPNWREWLRDNPPGARNQRAFPPALLRLLDLNAVPNETPNGTAGESPRETPRGWHDR